MRIKLNFQTIFPSASKSLERPCTLVHAALADYDLRQSHSQQVHKTPNTSMYPLLTEVLDKPQHHASDVEVALDTDRPLDLEVRHIHLQSPRPIADQITVRNHFVNLENTLRSIITHYPLTLGLSHSTWEHRG